MESWERDGYALVERVRDADTCAVMHDRIVELCRAAAAGEPIGDSIVDPERNPWPEAREPEDFVSKIFILHTWDPVFRSFARDPRLLDVIASSSARTSTASCRSSSSRTPARSGSPGTRTRCTSRSSPTTRSASGSP